MKIPAKKKAVWCALAALTVFGCFQPSAYAYLDPGSGSYLFQILLSFILGAIFSLKIFWKKIAGFFTKIFSKTQAPGAK